MKRTLSSFVQTSSKSVSLLSAEANKWQVGFTWAAKGAFARAWEVERKKVLEVVGKQLKAEFGLPNTHPVRIGHNHITVTFDSAVPGDWDEFELKLGSILGSMRNTDRMLRL